MSWVDNLKETLSFSSANCNGVLLKTGYKLTIRLDGNLFYVTVHDEGECVADDKPYLIGQDRDLTNIWFYGDVHPSHIVMLPSNKDSMKKFLLSWKNKGFLAFLNGFSL